MNPKFSFEPSRGTITYMHMFYRDIFMYRYDDRSFTEVNFIFDWLVNG